MAIKKYKLRMINGQVVDIELEETITVGELKLKLQEQEGLDVAQQRILLKGKNLTDEKSLNDHGVAAGDTLYLLIQLKGGF